MGISPNNLGKYFYFLFNGSKIRINEENDLISYGLFNGCQIIVIDIGF